MDEIRIRVVPKPWNKGELVAQKSPLKLKEIWAIRVRLQIFLPNAGIGAVRSWHQHLPVAAIQERPLLRATGSYDEVKPVAIGIAPGLFGSFDRTRREKVLLALPSLDHTRVAQGAPTFALADGAFPSPSVETFLGRSLDLLCAKVMGFAVVRASLTAH